MDLTKVSKAVSVVSDNYAKKFGIVRDRNWYVLKLQEEMGELIQSYLMMIGNARQKNKTEVEIKAEFHKEMADVFCHVLLLAKEFDVDLEKEVSEKWLVWQKDDQE
jgi:NTP pyrophosphatase (non-canonical NTP hydrolase)